MIGDPSVTIVGSLGGDPELRFTPSGSAVANFSVAVTSRKKDGDSWKDAGTTWYRCTVWNTPAENAAESLAKGDRVIVQGELHMRSWEAKDGAKGQTLEMDVKAFGPELRYATAKVSRLQREDSGQSNWSGNQDWSGSADPPPF